MNTQTFGISLVLLGFLATAVSLLSMLDVNTSLLVIGLLSIASGLVFSKTHD